MHRRSLSVQLRQLPFGHDESTGLRNDAYDEFFTSENAPLASPIALQTFSGRGKPPTSFAQDLLSSLPLSISPRRLLRYLVPSFLNNRLARQPSSTGDASNPKTTTKVSTLDGLRGVACLLVFSEHYTYNFSNTLLFGYGVEERRELIQYPFIRIFFSGFSMVAIFFVISGYVLSYKPLQQMRSRKNHDLFKTLTSSVFRRGFRLFLPPIIATWIAGFLVYLGAFRAGKAVWLQGNNYYHLHEPPPPEYQGLLNQMRDAVLCSSWILNIWDWNNDLISVGDYDLHTWTLPIEFRCSMALFLVHMATARLRQKFRLLANVSIIIFCILSNRIHINLFFAGMLIADLDMSRQSASGTILPESQDSPASRLKAGSTGWLALFFIGIYLASVPVLGYESTLGYMTLCSWVPPSIHEKAWFIRSVGAVFITWSAANSETLKPFFTNRISTYLGQVSFALYLVHGNVLKSIQYASMPWLYWIAGVEDIKTVSTKSLVTAWLIGLLLVLPVTFWLSDLFWRGVDIPCVRFSRWLEGKLTDESGGADIAEQLISRS